MLTINQADLFYTAEYALAALLLLLCTWKRGRLDIRRQIGRKVFFRRLLLALFVVPLERVFYSVLAAVVMGVFLWISHRPGRYVGG